MKISQTKKGAKVKKFNLCWCNVKRWWPGLSPTTGLFPAEAAKLHCD